LQASSDVSFQTVRWQTKQFLYDLFSLHTIVYSGRENQRGFLCNICFRPLP
jgi:hypothetical protein